MSVRCDNSKSRRSTSFLGLSPIFPVAKPERIKIRLPSGARYIRIKVLIVLPASGHLRQIRREDLIAHLPEGSSAFEKQR